MAQNNLVKVKVLIADLQDCDPEAYVLIQDEDADWDLEAYERLSKPTTDGVPHIVLLHREIEPHEYESVAPEEAE